MSHQLSSAPGLCTSHSRVDYLLVWGHGLQYESDIISIVEDEENFEILYVYRYRPRNMRRFVRLVYSHDYAPFTHLREKTKYLLSTPREVLFIFLLNKEPKEFAIGAERYRHVECSAVKSLKNKIRNRFNPRTENGEVSHNHVVHMSDNNQQTDHILQELHLSTDGKALVALNFPLIKLRPHLAKVNSVSIRSIKLSSLNCSYVVGSRWHYEHERGPLQDSPHFKALTNETPQIYADYLNEFRGTALRDGYSVRGFLSLADNFEYLADPFGTSYVSVVEESDGNFRVVDGLHRAAILKRNGEDELLAAVIS